MIEVKKHIEDLAEAARTAFIDEKNIPVDPRAELSTLIQEPSTTTEKAKAVFRLINYITAGALDNTRLSPLQYKFKELPLSIEPRDEINRINYGYVNNVFLVESPQAEDPKFVLKITRRKLENSNITRLVKLAEFWKKEVEIVKRAFSNRPEMVPDEHYFITQSPTGSYPCIASIQQFYGNMNDLFSLSPEELKFLANGYPEFKADIEYLYQQLTNENSTINNQKRVLDTKGKNNVAVVGKDTNPRVVILDPHFHYLKGAEAAEDRSFMDLRVGLLKNTLS